MAEPLVWDLTGGPRPSPVRVERTLHIAVVKCDGCGGWRRADMEQEHHAPRLVSRGGRLVRVNCAGEPL